MLYKNEIIISTLTSKPLLFNYVAFIKDLSISKLARMIKVPERNNKWIIMTQEIFKILMNNTCLKTLGFCSEALCFNSI